MSVGNNEGIEWGAILWAVIVVFLLVGCIVVIVRGGL